MRLWLLCCVGLLAGCNGLSMDTYGPATPSAQDNNGTTGETTSGSSTPTSTPTPTATDGDTNQTITTPTPTPSPMMFNCDTTKYPVCDGFELAALNGPPDANRWNSNVTLPSVGDPAVHSVHPTEDSITISNKFAHTGTQSLHFHTVGDWEHIPIQDVNSAMFPTPFLPAPNNTFFVRYWVYHDSNATTFDSGGHWYMVNASGPLAGRQQYEKMGGGGTTLGWNYYGDDSGIGSNMAWPLGAWNCFEVEFKGDTAELHVWKNDTEINDMEAAPGHWAAPAYNRLTIGWEMDHPSGGYNGADVYVDDVAYSYSRIHCAVATP